MERNTDPDVVVINRSNFDLLVHYARIGSYEATGSGEEVEEIERHARKWNTPIMNESKEQAEKRRAEDKRLRERLKKLLAYTDRRNTFYQIEEHVVGGFRVMSRSDEGKHLIRGYDTLTKKILNIPIDKVFIDLPDGYRPHQIGKYAGQFVHHEKRAF